MILAEAPPGVPDLEQAFHDGSLQYWKESQRHDTEVAHVSDISGMCDRLAWARRAGKPMADPDHESVTNMSMGLHLEDYLLDRIEVGLASQGWRMERNLVVVLAADANGEVVGTHYEKGNFQWLLKHGAAVFNPQTMVKGHIDAALIKDNQFVIIDTKTKSWDKKWFEDDGARLYYPGKTFRDSHIIQIGSYGLGFNGARYGAIFEFNKAHSESRTGWFELSDAYPTVKRRFFEVLERSNPSQDEPQIGPLEWTINASGDSWACGYTVPIAKGPNAGKQRVKKAYCEYQECPNHIVQKLKMVRELQTSEADDIIGGEIL